VQLTRQEAGGRQVIQRYGAGQFRVSGVVFPSSILVLPGQTTPWSATAMEDLTAESFAALLPVAGTLDVCLLGCGARMKPLPAALRAQLKEAGLTVDPMDTGAACRTFNVLTGEGRSVAAALIAV